MSDWTYIREQHAARRKARKRAAWLVFALIVLLAAFIILLCRRCDTQDVIAAEEQIASNIEERNAAAQTEDTLHMTAPDWEKMLVDAAVNGDERVGADAAAVLDCGYTFDDLYLLAKILEKEAGDDWPDAPILAVADVILNRRASVDYPDTIRGVLYQPAQYEPVYWTGWEAFNPSERFVLLAKRALEGEHAIPADAMYQALFPQGTITYMTYYDEALGTTTYFCK